MKYLLLLKLVSLGFLSAYAQVPPSPNAASQAKFASTPVNMYTGIPNIQAPLLTLPGRHTNVPVGLSYHAGGFKVQEIAGPVGLGWALNAGGVITRTVQGLPDDATNGYSGANASGTDIGQEDLRDYGPVGAAKVGNGEIDGQPDLYYFNLMGRVGQFTLDADRNAVLMPYQDIAIRVDPDETGAFAGWTITTEDGTVYEFGTTEETRETTRAQTIVDGTDEGPARTFTSSWYLTEVRAPGSSEVITFAYESGGEVTYDYYSHVWTQAVDTCNLENNTQLGGPQSITTRITLRPSRRLAGISSALGTVSLTYRHDRPDVAGQALTDITLSNRSGQVEQHLKLRYSEFDGCYQGNSYADDGECRRLRLDQVEDVTSANTPLPPLYTFDYNTDTYLPSRQTGLYDDWGYARRGGSSLSEYPWLLFEPVTLGGTTYNFSRVSIGSGSDRDPDPRWGQAFLLTRFTNATGGYTTYEYEGHYTGSDPQNRENRVGGVRIKAVRTYDGQSTEPSTETTYDYRNSGQAPDKPEYTWSFKLDGCNVLLRRYAQSPVNLFDLNGVAIGYREVRAVRRDGSQTIYRYTNFSSYPDEKTIVYRMREGSDGFPVLDDGRRRGSRRNGASDTRRYNEPPYPPNESRSWQRGLPIEEAHLSASGDTVQKTNYYYLLDKEARARVAGLKVEIIEGTFFDYDYRLGEYDMVSQPVFLDYRVDETFDQTDPRRSVAVRTDYTYNEDFLTLTQTKTTNSEGQDVTMTYQRARDLNNNLLTEKHMHSQVLEQSTRVGGNITQKATTAYTLQNDLVVPTQVTTYPNGTGDGISVTYRYDTYGNVTQSQRQNDVPTAYLWGYNHSLKVAEVVGTTYNNATAGLNLSVLQGNDPAAIRTELDQLRSTNRLVTTYTYTPLVGMTSETNPAKITTYQEYDDRNRLQYVRDHRQQYVARYRYYYQGQPK